MKWAIREPGFIGSIKQLIACARCGQNLPLKAHNEPRHCGHKPALHFICDDCFDSLPQ